MNFYPHHLGDYAKDTGHLSVMEHGAYRLLMDYYYSTETPLPDDFPTLFRLCRAVTQIEKTAVKSVIMKFFPLENGARTHKRIEHELSLYRERVEVNKVNGSKGGRPKKEKPIGFPVGSVLETQTITETKPTKNPIQYPITNNQSIPPAKAEKTSDPRHSPIVKLWEEAYKNHNKEPYVFHGTRDFSELSKLLAHSTDLTPEHFIRVAQAAWRASGDLYTKAVKNSGTITLVCQNWNAIVTELNARKNGAPALKPSKPPTGV